MIFDLKIGTKATQKQPKEGPKELRVSSSMFASNSNRFWLHFGPLLEPFWHLKIVIKSILILLENQLAAT